MIDSVQNIVANLLLGQIKAQIARQTQKKLSRIKKEIRPFAHGMGGGIGGMRNVSRNAGDIAFSERQILTVIKSQHTGIGLTDSDFQTIVKMQRFRRNIRKSPYISRQKKHRKISRKIIVSVFNYGLTLFRRHIYPRLEKYMLKLHNKSIT